MKNKTRVSQLEINGTTHRVETLTDAVQLISNLRQLDSYIEKYGDVEIVKDGRVYRVPAFTERIESYTAAKAADCRKWGSE
jgi:hypothetical protein